MNADAHEGLWRFHGTRGYIPDKLERVADNLESPAIIACQQKPSTKTYSNTTLPGWY